MTYAIIETGGKQYRVQVGDRISVEKLAGDRGTPVVFDKVLLMAQEGQVTVGTPYVPKVKVMGSIERQRKLTRVRIFKMKPKKNVRRRRGHRQMVTDVRIVGIHGDQ